ncbi:MAG: AlkZ family DNA glycosylase [Thermaceae bacterium]|nr:AlkZ family DNA glycosylase [Thermaceae bacterium]
MTLSDIAHLRLHNQHLTRPVFNKPGEVVRSLGAVQAQDYLASLWAVGLRLPNATEADVEQAIANREMVRTWPMRGTIHYVAPEAARWMLGLLTPRVIARSAGRYRALELDDSVFSHSRRVLEKALQDGKLLTRGAICKLLEAEGIVTAESRGLHILGHWAQKGLICFGPRAAKQPTFVLLDRWIPRSKTLERDEALAQLARRYFKSHGPATLQDFAWWSGLTVADAKVGLEPVKPEFTHADVNDVTYWFIDNVGSGEIAPQLLPFFDEFLVAYKDRGAALEPSHTPKVNAGGGLLNPTVVLNGRVVGTWKRTFKKDTVFISLNLFMPLSKVQTQAVHAAAERYGRFVKMMAMVN